MSIILHHSWSWIHLDPNFLASNAKPMANNGARDHVLTVTRLSQWDLILIQYISHLRLPHVKIGQRCIQWYAHSRRSNMLRTQARTEARILRFWYIVRLPRNITKEYMIYVKHGLLLVWGEETLSLPDGALSMFLACLGFDTVLRFCYSLVRFFYSSATGNRFFMVLMVRHIRY